VSSSRAACLEFLRHIEEHSVSAREAGVLPSHALGCAACAGHLRIACSLGAHLRVPPPIPADLRSPQFVEQIHERVVAALTADGLGASIVGSLQSVRAPASMPWPLQKTEEGVAHQLRGASARAPGWVRQLVLNRTRRSSRRAVIGRGVTAAAMVVLLAILGWRSGHTEGTPSEFQFVIVPVPEMPSVHHPTAVLRLGGVR
jgi:hypothetical protein